MTPVNPATPNAGGFTGGIQPGQAPAKPVAQYTLVGTRVPRIDIPDIVTGKDVYIQNVRVPGMLHGRVVRPRGQTLFGFGVPIVSVDESSIAHIYRACRSSARTTSSASSRRRSTTRSRLRRS